MKYYVYKMHLFHALFSDSDFDDLLTLIYSSNVPKVTVPVHGESGCSVLGIRNSSVDIFKDLRLLDLDIPFAD